MFYKKGVNKQSAKSMFEFINNHYTYYTLNSWNLLESIANKVKLYDLDLIDEDKAFELMFDENDESGLQWMLNTIIKNWEYEHPNYLIGFNGRSDGYMVMYNKENDGRVNFKSILPSYLTGYDNYEEWKEDMIGYYSDTIKGCIPMLREYTELIQDFDRLCDNMVATINAYCK